MEKQNFKLLSIASSFLKSQGIRNSNLEAQILLSFALGIRQEELTLFLYKKANYKTVKYFFTLLERLHLGEPMSYLRESKEFFSLSFYVNHNVLIPRPETELIPEYIINNINSFGGQHLDLCTGSGCILNTVKKETKVFERGLGSDIEISTLKIAVKNSKTHKTTTTYFKSDLLGNYNFAVRYKLITCNPPYIKSSDILNINNNIKYYEPIVALDGKTTGIFFYKVIARRLKGLLSKNGFFIIEIAFSQRVKVVSIFRREGFILKEILKDLSNNDRILIFKL